MSQPEDQPCVIQSVDNSTEIKLTFPTKTIELRHYDSATATGMVFQTTLKALDKDGDPAVWARLQDALKDLRSGAPRTEDAFHLQLLAERGKWPLKTLSRQLLHTARWLFRSRENTNHTYNLTPLSRKYLAHTVASVTQTPLAAIEEFIAEAESDTHLADHILAARTAQSVEARAVSDAAVRFGRRLGWYAVVRALNPALVIETGVDKGLGSVLLCAALLRNRAEGHEGRYLGTDINPEAGYLLSGPYAAVGKIMYGDSLESLRTLTAPVDVFINDSDHSTAYEAQEYEVIYPLLSDRGLVLSDNAHTSPALADAAAARGQRFLFWREQPAEHWYAGAGIGFAFREGGMR
jgi:predicted O-methyltransferase YrrM